MFTYTLALHFITDFGLFVQVLWILKNTEELKEKLKENLRNKSDFLKNGTIRDQVWTINLFRNFILFFWSYHVAYFVICLQVRFGVVGWKNRYYKLKFSAETDWDIEIKRTEIVCVLTMKSTLLYLDQALFCYCNLVYICRSKSTEGLIWVLLYYISGVPSWSWSAISIFRSSGIQYIHM